MKLEQEEAYHLIDLLKLDIKETPNKILLSDNQKKEAIKYNKKLIKKLKRVIDAKMQPL